MGPPKRERPALAGTGALTSNNNSDPLNNVEIAETQRWSPQQIEALDRAERWLERRDKPVFQLRGFAGTGKTTLLRYIAGLAGKRVLFAAFTGKAASVMARKGCAGATTIDRLVYRHPFEWRCTQGCRNAPCRALCPYARQEFLGRRLNPESDVADANLVILDECSMVDEEMARDLMSFGVQILVAGDDGQLPPITGAGYFSAQQPDVLLIEVHRQALDSPVIALATMARAGKFPMPGIVGDCEVVRAADYNGDPTSFDITICGTNSTRRELNTYIRDLLGFTDPLPMIGEKLLVLRNRHLKGLMNGEIVTVADVGRVKNGFLHLTVITDDGRAVNLAAPIDLLLQDESNATSASGDPCTWGYAITAHKAQGSQWDSVLLFDESRVFREHRRRWLYTGITRAAQRITLVVGL